MANYRCLYAFSSSFFFCLSFFLSFFLIRGINTCAGVDKYALEAKQLAHCLSHGDLGIRLGRRVRVRKDVKIGEPFVRARPHRANLA